LRWVSASAIEVEERFSDWDGSALQQLWRSASAIGVEQRFSAALESP
jgi:hypothetical protein